MIIAFVNVSHLLTKLDNLKMIYNEEHDMLEKKLINYQEHTKWVKEKMLVDQGSFDQFFIE